MNIWALKGHKVIFNGTGGYESQLENAKRLLEIGKEYTVESTDVHSSSTDVILQEITATWTTSRRITFNSVHFDDVTPQSQELNEQHHQWAWYNVAIQK